jgi:murein DD-endopeptidase MepM/ murein hydrolase activator NlpD
VLSKKTVREKYEDKMKKDSGKNNPSVNAWLNAAEYSLNNPLGIPPTYSESGIFSANNHTATSLKVFIKRGQKLVARLNKTSAMPYAVYMDLWRAADTTTSVALEYILAADTANNSFEYIATKDERLIIRYQPQLATDGSYAIAISHMASFTFPIAASAKSNIGSFWGDGRDGGARKHEGIDIFAAAKSPAVAVADGYISSVSENILGGKVIFMQPDNSNYNVYYAHLHQQLVTTGQRVKAGEVIGLTGNTGNALYTASHLHFGIYTFSGAIDPLAFVEKIKEPGIKMENKVLNPAMITSRQTKVYADLFMLQPIATLNKNIRLQAEAFNGQYYRVILPDGRKAFAEAKNLTIQKVKSS